jgi:hypothetical protein
LSLCQNGRISLGEIVTQVVHGPEGLCGLLQSPGKLLEENCKVLASFDGSRT